MEGGGENGREEDWIGEQWRGEGEGKGVDRKGLEKGGLEKGGVNRLRGRGQEGRERVGVVCSANGSTGS